MNKAIIYQFRDGTQETLMFPNMYTSFSFLELHILLFFPYLENPEILLMQARKKVIDGT